MATSDEFFLRVVKSMKTLKARSERPRVHHAVKKRASGKGCHVCKNSDMWQFEALRNWKEGGCCYQGLKRQEEWHQMKFKREKELDPAGPYGQSKDFLSLIFICLFLFSGCNWKLLSRVKQWDDMVYLEFYRFQRGIENNRNCQTTAEKIPGHKITY